MKTDASNLAVGKIEHGLRIATAKAQESEEAAEAAKEKARLAKIKAKSARRAFKQAKRAAKEAVKLAWQFQDELKAWKKKAAKGTRKKKMARQSSSPRKAPLN